MVRFTAALTLAGIAVWGTNYGASYFSPPPPSPAATAAETSF
jgi:hypothetical protein